MIILKLDTTREKEDKKNVEESEETDEEKEHTDENEDDIMQLAQGPKKGK